MSVADHRAAAPAHVRCAVLTISDSRTAETDTGGRAIAELLTEFGHTVVDRRLVRDDPDAVSAFVRDTAERGEADVIITTGGTGITRRDSTYEAVTQLFEKELVGFGELFRMLSHREIGSAAMLSRATAGLVSPCAVFVLPGSEHAVRLAMTRLILPEIGHVVREITR
jgi:molybdenum cofactor biosynthesis protein B